MNSTHIISTEGTDNNNVNEQSANPCGLDLKALLDQVEDETECDGEVEDGLPEEQPVAFENLQCGPTRVPAASRKSFLDALELNAAHREHLRTSGLNDEMIRLAGLKSVTDEQAAALGFRRLSGIVIRNPPVKCILFS